MAKIMLPCDKTSETRELTKHLKRNIEEKLLFEISF